jgi:16S rRNA processing protein RimM
MEDYVSIGTLAATFGVKGEIVVNHHLGGQPNLAGIEVFFIEETTDRFIPYFITELKIRSEGELVVSFEGISTPEIARKYLKKKVWLNAKDAKRIASKSAPISLLGFSVIEQKNFLGTVLEVIEQPLQILLRIEMEEKEVLIPINESTLVKIDHKGEKIHVDLPDGLLDIYLS